MRTVKKLMAFVLAAALVTGLSVPAQAKRDWIDGDTPEDQNNRIEPSEGERIRPTVRTNFHAAGVEALIPISPKAVFDQETGVDKSAYEDAYSLVYVCDNDYGPLAAQVIENTIGDAPIETANALIIHLFSHENDDYRTIENTSQDLTFALMIPDAIRDENRDYAILRLNEDRTMTFLTDLDTDPVTLTFNTNYFGGMNLYCIVYGGKGCFDAYKPAE